MNSKENGNKIFENKSINKKTILYVFVAITFFIITFVPFAYESSVLGYLLLGLFAAFGICSAIKLIINYNKSDFLSIVFSLCIGTMFGWTTLQSIINVSNEPKYFFGYIYGVIVITGIMYIIKIIPKRTSYGNELLGKIKGFRNFLEIVEKDKLEAMVMENPNYFYDILPYTYVLGISEKWIEKFEKISLQPPSWYDSSTGFSVAAFGKFINTTMSQAQIAMTSSPSGSSDGSSGGGSSGGGSGGGGGGSW